MFVPRRLDKYLRDSTPLSIMEIRKACAEGRVALGGVSALDSPQGLAEALVFEEDRITLDGARVVPKTQYHYLVLNKPRYITTTANDPKGRSDLAPWLRQMPAGAFPVGRLDRETSGALLFTDDGDFSNAILQPDRHTEKLYWLWLDESMEPHDPRLAALAGGVQCPSSAEVLRATSVTVQHRTADCIELLVTLDEGKNRHLRKMCNILRLRLVQLHRKAIGPLSVEDLGVGQWRHLTAREVAALWSSCGGRERAIQIKIAALRELAVKLRLAHQAHQRLEAWLQRVGAG